jgi:uncharacterized repeat protein (TIGR04138 family)
MSKEPDTQHSNAPKGELVDLETAIRREVLSHDARFEIGAYLFLYEALGFTQKRLGRDARDLPQEARHVSGAELLEGIHAYAHDLFGPLAPTVFKSWGIRKSSDFGDIVFNLVEHNLLGKTEGDRREDFEGGFDLENAFDGPLQVGPA